MKHAIGPVPAGRPPPRFARVRTPTSGTAGRFVPVVTAPGRANQRRPGPRRYGPPVTADTGTWPDPIEAESRRPLARATRASRDLAAHQSGAVQEAAENLLAKALRHLSRDDGPRATAIIERALALPFDEHEEVQPALWQAHMLLFDLVSEAAETSDDEDSAWLDAALAALDAAPAVAAAELKAVLATMASDYHLLPQETRRIRAATPGADPYDEEDLGARYTTGGATAADGIRQVLELAAGYAAATQLELLSKN